MKQERIAELLNGTKYENAKYVPHTRDDGLEGWHPNLPLEFAHDDCLINAARVQLLAKALKTAQYHLDQLANGYALPEMHKAVDDITCVLKEAGLEG